MRKNSATSAIRELAKLTIGMHGKDFLLTWEKSDQEIRATLLTAEILRSLYESNVSLRLFQSGLAVSIFRDKSTRTRFSFASAANLLGLGVQDLDEEKSQIAHGETVRETANMISFLTEAIGIRDDMYIGEGNKYMREVAAALDEGLREGVLPQRPAIVNLQCDIDHPTQAMADLCHLKREFGGLDKLKGRKIAMTWAYSPSYGKPLSVPQGIIGLMTRFGMEVVLAHPEGYTLLPETLKIAQQNAKKSGGAFRVAHSMEEAFKNADIVYPKSWAPFSVMEQRTQLLRAGDSAGLKDLERRALENNARFKTWECNEKLMALTRSGGDTPALYMHCLPADISGVSCKEGEVSGKVFEKYRITTYREASFKPFIIASMILLSKFKSPAGLLAGIGRKKLRRISG
ncbi:MAG: knotted carbamoyltransferase YgeW [Candidatus Lindowbacteria bacterium RIFCSPLOWO2_12_FULL_62_27]|nr:MAG: knotted carbamoyltransferase YgeW [Candidatus Lindowbacteria bacterium RIFCSPLOWO2_02_FULL_62_12]OGH59618.1 MAG: knotted carbamoyltransferase YgeW [Candidatus Lindowbacteria bacterium RIFCSPLOWO2_12_FULL_62_27]